MYLPYVQTFIDIYQASLNQKGKKVESHSNILDKANVETNNVLITNDPNTPIGIKGLDVSNFFEDLNEKIDHLIGGSVLGPDN